MIFLDRNEESNVQFHAVKRTLDRIKAKVMPPPPNTIENIPVVFQNPEVMELFGRTKQKKNTEKNQFYRTTFVSALFAYTIFASQRVIDIINTFDESKRRFAMDGTFNVVPRLFKQLLIIYFCTPLKQVSFFVSFFKKTIQLSAF